MTLPTKGLDHILTNLLCLRQVSHQLQKSSLLEHRPSLDEHISRKTNAKLYLQYLTLSAGIHSVHY
jgi:hypothetical protein